MANSQFVKIAGNDKVYQKLGNGVLDPVLNTEDFYRRSGSRDIGGNTQTINSLEEAYQPEINSQVSAQIDPSLNLAQDQANSDTGLVKTSNQRLLDSIAKIYSQKRENDPLAKAGVYSGAADIYNTGQNVDQVTQANQDLTSQLSDIANRLKTTQTNAQTQKSGLQSTLLQQYLGNNSAYQEKQAALKADANKVTSVDLGGSIALMRPDGTIVKTIRKSATPGSGAASLSTDAGKNAALINAVRNEIATGNYTSTGESGKQSREQLIGKLSGAFAGTGINVQDIKDAVYGNVRNLTEGAYTPGKTATQSAQQSSDANSLLSAFSSLDAASANLGAAGGGKSLAGLLSKSPLLGQYFDPKGAAYESTKIELATSLAKAITGGSRPAQTVIEQYLHSLPSRSDTPETIQLKLDDLKNALTTRAKALGVYDQISSNGYGGNIQGPAAPASSNSNSSGWSLIK